MKKFTIREHALLAKRYLLDYPRILEFPRLDEEVIREYQFREIRKLISHAYHQTKFYHELYSQRGITPEDVRTWSDFEQLPTISKEDIVGRESELVLSTKNVRDLRVSRSSGSSGQMVNIISDSDRWLSSSLIMFRTFHEAFGFHPVHDGRGALVYTSVYPYISRFSLFRAHFIHTLDTSSEIMRRIVQLRPAYLVIYPSILAELIAEFPEQCADLRMDAINTNSEQSTQAQRDRMSAVFGCPVFDEYSTEELLVVAFQCRDKAYHLQEDCTYVEILDPASNIRLSDGSVGEIVGTCLINPSMPLIRYRQGDLGVVRTSTCGCSNNGRVLSEVSGRKNASFRLPDGRIIPSGRILDWTYELVLAFALPIRKFQVTQISPETVEVTLVVDSDYPVHGDRIVSDSFRRLFGDLLNVVVSRVRDIPRTPAGKHIPIQSLL